MSIESLLFSALKGLVGNRCYPDVAPDKTQRPYITYQQVGGQAINFVDGSDPGKRNARMQVNVWADSRAQASALAQQVESALRASALQTTVLGAAVATYEPETCLRGARQDFSLWY